jgi:hypothetical protein
MDATRNRRTRDRARQGWYARYRQCRFARYLGFADGPEAPLAVAAACQLSLKDRMTIGHRHGTASAGPHAAIPASHGYVHSLAVAAG